MVSEGKEDETATASSHAKNKCLRLLILVTMSLNSIFPKRESDFYVLQLGVTDSYCAWGAEWDHVRVLWYNKAAWIYCFHSGEGGVDAQKRGLRRKGTSTGSRGTSR